MNKKRKDKLSKELTSDRSWGGKNILTGEEASRPNGSQTGVKNFRYELRKDGSFEVFHDGVSIGFQKASHAAGSAGHDNDDVDDEPTT